jgi:hypothetical protein
MANIYILTFVLIFSLKANVKSQNNHFNFTHSEINVNQKNSAEVKTHVLAWNQEYKNPPVEKKKAKKKKRLRRKKKNRKKGLYSMQIEPFMHKKSMLIVAITAAILIVFLAFVIAFNLFSPIAALCVLLVLEIIAVLILIYQTTYYEGSTPAVFAFAILLLFNLIAGVVFIIVGALLVNPFIWIAGIVFLLAFLLAIFAGFFFSGMR